MNLWSKIANIFFFSDNDDVQFNLWSKIATKLILYTTIQNDFQINHKCIKWTKKNDGELSGQKPTMIWPNFLIFKNLFHCLNLRVKEPSLFELNFQKHILNECAHYLYKCTLQKLSFQIQLQNCQFSCKRGAFFRKWKVGHLFFNPFFTTNCFPRFFSGVCVTERAFLLCFWSPPIQRVISITRLLGDEKIHSGSWEK